MKTPWSALVWSFLLLPWTTAFVLGAFALNVLVGLGHWPQPMTEPYSTPLTRWLDQLTLWLFMATGCSILVAPGALLQRICWTDPHYRRKAWVYLAGLAALVAACGALESTSFLEWWID